MSSHYREGTAPCVAFFNERLEWCAPGNHYDFQFFLINLIPRTRQKLDLLGMINRIMFISRSHHRTEHPRASTRAVPCGRTLVSHRKQSPWFSDDPRGANIRKCNIPIMKLPDIQSKQSRLKAILGLTFGFTPAFGEGFHASESLFTGGGGNGKMGRDSGEQFLHGHSPPPPPLPPPPRKAPESPANIWCTSTLRGLSRKESTFPGKTSITVSWKKIIRSDFN